MKLDPIAPNQTVVEIGNNTVFFSYKTPVAAYVDGRAYRTSKFWSMTTSRHINAWMGKGCGEEKPQEFFDALSV